METKNDRMDDEVTEFVETSLSRQRKVSQVCLLAGKILLENGAETYRVEDTMIRIAAALGAPGAQSFVTPTGIVFSLDSLDSATSLMRINERSTDLRKVTAANDISRRIGSGELSVEEAYERLLRLDASTERYPLGFKLLIAAVASGCFLVMFDGEWRDFLAAMLCGGAGYAAASLLPRYVPIKLFSEFAAALAVGALACLLVQAGGGQDLDKIVIGSIMPLVPGVLITNAVRDLMAGHFVSGVSKGAEACLTAFAIGAGIALVLSVLGGGGGIGL